MSPALGAVPEPHRPALEKWIATAGPPAVARCLAWLATQLLHRTPQAKLFGLSGPELLILVQDITPTLNLN